MNQSDIESATIWFAVLMLTEPTSDPILNGRATFRATQIIQNKTALHQQGSPYYLCTSLAWSWHTFIARLGGLWQRAPSSWLSCRNKPISAPGTTGSTDMTLAKASRAMGRHQQVACKNYKTRYETQVRGSRYSRNKAPEWLLEGLETGTAALGTDHTIRPFFWLKKLQPIHLHTLLNFNHCSRSGLGSVQRFQIKFELNYKNFAI